MLFKVDTAGKKLGDGKRDMEEVLESIKTAKGNLEESLNNAREVSRNQKFTFYLYQKMISELEKLDYYSMLLTEKDVIFLTSRIQELITFPLGYRQNRRATYRFTNCRGRRRNAPRRRCGCA